MQDSSVHKNALLVFRCWIKEVARHSALLLITDADEVLELRNVANYKYVTI